MIDSWYVLAAVSILILIMLTWLWIQRSPGALWTIWLFVPSSPIVLAHSWQVRIRDMSLAWLLRMPRLQLCLLNEEDEIKCILLINVVVAMNRYAPRWWNVGVGLSKRPQAPCQNTIEL